LRIALAVGGGIAAYKAAELTRLLIQRGHHVQAILTRGAQEFITPLTFATLTGRKTITGLFSNNTPEATLASAVEHISVAEENDLLLVAPATANIMSHFAHGLADDFLSTLYLAFTGPVMLAPAMNMNMWTHPATQANLETLRVRGHILIAPTEGFLACGMSGPGRLADPLDIADAVERQLHPVTDFSVETVLITAGPTQEPIDPVRFLSNHSSGKMGYALAQAAINRGARVTLISGPVNLTPPNGARCIKVRTAQEMRDQVFANLEGVTMVIKCAAVADFHVAAVAPQKIKKNMPGFSVELEPTVDILAELGQKKGPWLLIGFAAETQNLQQEALRKLQEKNCDMIVGNLVGQPGTGFESGHNEVLLVTKSDVIEIPRATKQEVAGRILTQALALRHAN